MVGISSFFSFPSLPTPWTLFWVPLGLGQGEGKIVFGGFTTNLTLVPDYY